MQDSGLKIVDSQRVQTLIGKPALLKEVLEFNLRPIHYIHPSWLAELPHAVLIERLRSSPRATTWLSHYLLSHWRLEQRYWYDFSTPVACLALAEANVLEKLVLYLGLVLNIRYIRQTVERDKVRVLKQRIGEEAFLFTLKRAPFLGLGTPPSTTELSASLPPEDFPQKVRAIGVHCLASTMAEYDDPCLIQRLLFKFPKAHQADFVITPELRERPDVMALPIKLLTNLEPQWAHLLNT